jgi:hypothetical protein
MTELVEMRPGVLLARTLLSDDPACVQLCVLNSLPTTYLVTAGDLLGKGEQLEVVPPDSKTVSTDGRQRLPVPHLLPARLPKPTNYRHHLPTLSRAVFNRRATDRILYRPTACRCGTHSELQPRFLKDVYQPRKISYATT